MTFILFKIFRYLKIIKINNMAIIKKDKENRN